MYYNLFYAVVCRDIGYTDICNNTRTPHKYFFLPQKPASVSD